MFSEILVMTRQKSHVFESEKVGRCTFLVQSSTTTIITMYYYKTTITIVTLVFVISRIIKISLLSAYWPLAQLIRFPLTLIILGITKTSSSNNNYDDMIINNQLLFVNYHIIIIITCFRKAAQWVGETDPRKRSSSSSSTDWTAWVETTSTMSKKDSIYSQNMWIWGMVWCACPYLIIKYSSNYEISTVR